VEEIDLGNSPAYVGSNLLSTPHKRTLFIGGRQFEPATLGFAIKEHAPASSAEFEIQQAESKLWAQVYSSLTRIIIW
jgi:hypothetical protein